jgi:hypothetical protein
VLSTSNILASRISDTSNYVLSTSNILESRISDTSNYVLSTSNILASRISDTSNYVLSTSNILASRISDTSNYVLSTSNILASHISDTSNYVLSTSNILIAKVNLNDSNSSNYVLSTSNLIIEYINNKNFSQWTTYNNIIYYNSNVAIGTINSNSNIQLNVSGITNSTEYYVNNVPFISERLSVPGTSNYTKIYQEPTIFSSIYTSNITVPSNGTFKTLTFNYFPTPTPIISDANLVAWYKFDGDGLDYNPNATKYHLTTDIYKPDIVYSDGSNYWQGRRYLEANFNGITSNANLQLGNVFSVSVWIRSKTKGVNGHNILYNDFNQRKQIYIGYSLENNQIRFANYVRQSFTDSIYDATEYYNQTIPIPSVSVYNTWIHLVFGIYVYTSSTNTNTFDMPIYMNGNLLNSTYSPAAKTYSDTIISHGNGFKISCGDFNSSADNSSADLRDLRIYNTALTAEQVSSLYISYTSNNHSINFSENNTAVVNNNSTIAVLGKYNISIENNNWASLFPDSNQSIYPLINPLPANTNITITFPISRSDIMYKYKKDGFLKYVAGDQNSIDTRDTGRWEIHDYDTIGSAQLGIVYDISTSNTSNINILTTRILDTSNYVLSTSNILVNRILTEVGFGSNYVASTSNILVNHILTEVGFGSNYVASTSNILVNRILTEVGFGSNYVASTSNILVNHILTEVGFGSNYVASTSNILVNHILTEVGFGSNYVASTSNILVNRILAEDIFGSNYVSSTSNILVNHILTEVGFGSNYVASTSNILADMIKNNKSSQWNTSNANIYYNNNVGINNAEPVSSLTINKTITDTISANIFNHSEAPLTITNQTILPNLDDRRDVLHLCRVGGATPYLKTGMRATFKLTKWETETAEANTSRTRLDIGLAHEAYKEPSINVMTIRSDRKVGINNTSPDVALHVGGDIKASGTITGAISVTNASGTLQVGNGGTGLTTFTNGGLLFASSSSAIGQTDKLFWDNTDFKLGVGTNSLDNKSSTLTINKIVTDTIPANIFDHSVAPLTITNQTSPTSLDHSIDVLHLCRVGTASGTNSIGMRATFRLGKWQDTNADSRTRLEIGLSNGAYNTSNIVMNIRSDGKVGIGITNPTVALDVNGDINIASGSLLKLAGVTYKPSSAGTADTLTIGRNIAGVSFNGSGAIEIPYFNLTNKLTAGSGITITAGSATTSPEISATGGASAPTSATLAGILNASQFTNNTGTSRVDISSSYIAPKATLLETGRNIAGVSFNGSGPIAIPYFNLTYKITAGSGISITAGSATSSPEISATAQTPTSATLAGILNASHFTNNTGTSRVDISSSYIAPKATLLETGRNIAGVSFNGSGPIAIPYFNLTYKITAGSGISITAGSATSSPEISATAQTPTSATLAGILNASHFTNNTGTSRVDISSSYIAPNATKLATVRNIAGVGFDGSGAIEIPYYNLTYKITAGSGISITAGSATSSPIISSSSSSQWLNNTTTPSKIYYDTSNVGIGTSDPITRLHVVGNIISTGDITAFYSDERLKTKISTINNPLSIVNKLHGFYYLPNEIATKYGINNNKIEIGLSAQDVQKVLPELVKLAPFDMKMNEAGEIISKSGEKYLTISYERIVPVLVEAIKELNQKNISFTNENNKTIKIDEHRAIINSLEERIKVLETKITRILNYINI